MWCWCRVAGGRVGLRWVALGRAASAVAARRARGAGRVRSRRVAHPCGRMASAWSARWASPSLRAGVLRSDARGPASLSAWSACPWASPGRRFGRLGRLGPGSARCRRPGQADRCRGRPGQCVGPAARSAWSCGSRRAFGRVGGADPPLGGAISGRLGRAEALSGVFSGFAVGGAAAVGVFLELVGAAAWSSWRTSAGGRRGARACPSPFLSVVGVGARRAAALRRRGRRGWRAGACWRGPRRACVGPALRSAWSAARPDWCGRGGRSVGGPGPRRGPSGRAWAVGRAWAWAWVCAWACAWACGRSVRSPVRRRGRGRRLAGAACGAGGTSHYRKEYACELHGAGDARTCSSWARGYEQARRQHTTGRQGER